jgi:hypothetical protein
LLALVFSTNAQNQVPGATTATSGMLTVTFSTNKDVASVSAFAAAIYISDSSNKLVNTLLYNTTNGDGRAQDMSTWWALIGSAWPSTAIRAAKTPTTINNVI